MRVSPIHYADGRVDEDAHRVRDSYFTLPLGRSPKGTAMSDTPGVTPSDPDVSTALPNPELHTSEPATTPSASETSRSRKKTLIVIGAAAAALLLLVVGGVWAFNALVLGKGQSVAESAVAFPASTIAWAEVSIDPSNDQKLAALGFAQNLPNFQELLDGAGVDLDVETAGPDTDLKESLWNALVSSQGSSATSLDYEADIKPWLGSRISVGLLPYTDPAVPTTIFAIESTNDSAATEAVTALLAEQDNPDDWTVGVRGGYVLIASVEVDLETVYEDGTLDGVEEFAASADGAGEWGILSAWTSPDFSASVLSTESAEEPAAVPAGASQFSVVRFVDGTLEVFGSTSGAEPGPAVGDAGAAVSAVPASSMLVGSIGSLGDILDYGLSDNGYTTNVVEAFTQAFAALEYESGAIASPEVEADPAETIAEARAAVTDFFESSFGLTFPEDVESLFGDSFTVVIDENVETDITTSTDPFADIAGSGFALVVASEDPAATAEKWSGILEQTTAQLGFEVGLAVSTEGNNVVIGAGDYAATVVSSDKTLGKDARALTVLPDLKGASGVLYLDVAAVAGLYRELTAQMSGATDDLGAVEGIEAIGFTGNRISDTETTFRLRISTIEK